MAVKIYIDGNKLMFVDGENTTAVSLTELKEAEMATHGDSHNIGGDDEISDLKEQSIITTSITSSATPTPARASKKTEYVITALEEAATFGAPTGTPENGDLLLITVKDDGTARTLAFNAIYTAPYSADKPTTTTGGKTLIMLFRYNSASSKWELLYVDKEA